LPVTVIPVGSNIEPNFINSVELRALRRQIFPEQAKVFGLFGTLSAFKNFPLAIRALERARRQGLDAWLYLIGSMESSNPKLFKELMYLAEKLRVKSYIVTSGELSHENISIQLQMVDVFIFPHTDGISTRNCTLMAALAHGLPVVSFAPQAGLFDRCDIPCGIFVYRHNEDEFIKAAVDSLKKSDDLSKTALFNRDYFYSNFSWPVIARRYLEVLGGLI
jgi:glycosyltransferase involved in cell wall biosynthesis